MASLTHPFIVDGMWCIYASVNYAIIGSDEGLAPSHYLKQCWFMINWITKNKFRINSYHNTPTVIQENEPENDCNLVYIRNAQAQLIVCSVLIRDTNPAFAVPDDVLTHNSARCCTDFWKLGQWGLGKLAVILHMTYSYSFSCENCILMQIRWNVLSIVQSSTGKYCIRELLGTETATSYYLKQWWPSLLTHICATWSQYIRYMTSLLK